ncbi:MAG: hypothetical protein IT480_03200 [Gammaproteobacteria bacterium]|nr:hypothetical protein [Gammaproteobacteria bacterium]
MLEQPVIQMRGFRNVRDADKVTGFQVAVRLPYYRGVWLSQLRPATVRVDGVVYKDAEVTWIIAGRTYEQRALAEHADVNWSNMEPAVLSVRKPGGLAPGFHDVRVSFQWSMSYMPPRLDLGPFGMSGAPPTRRMVLVQ